MSFELFVVALLAAILLFAIIKGLIFVALLVFVVAFAYYTGLAGAFFDFIIGLLPIAADDPEVAMLLMSGLLFA